jgi:hypothetical protein
MTAARRPGRTEPATTDTPIKVARKMIAIAAAGE